MERILIQNGRIFDGTAFFQGDVYIADGVVQSIAPNLCREAEVTFDAAGMTVLPGLVDVHMHMRGISSPAWCTDADTSCFPFGVTAAADASAMEGDRELLDSFRVKNGVFVITGTSGDRLVFDKALERLDRYASKVIGIKVCYDKTFNPALRDDSQLRQICSFAHSRGLPVAVHTAHTPIPMAQLLSVLESGDIATHVYHPGPNSAAEDDFACLLDARKRGVILDACICGNEHVDYAIFRDAIAAGAHPDVMGTDLADELVFTRGGRYGLTMCMSIARYLGMEETLVFRAVTSAAGKALRRPWGVLEEGCAADIAVLEWADAPMDITDKRGFRIQSDVGYRCRLTLSDGQIMYRE